MRRPRGRRRGDRALHPVETALAEQLIARIAPGVLLLADRGFTSYARWEQALASGADLLWRAKTDTRPEHLTALDDGSWLGRIRLSTDTRAAPISVRVIDYTIDDGRGEIPAAPSSYRLFTSILDPAEASATDLAAAYTRRWEIENTFDELKTHQRGPGWCCARNRPSWCSRRSGDACAATTRSAP